jgi:hypothetical protein
MEEMPRLANREKAPLVVTRPGSPWSGWISALPHTV